MRAVTEMLYKKDQNEIELNTGYHYLVLLKLPYFDSTKMLVVDDMHNLFLGTSWKVFTDSRQS